MAAPGLPTCPVCRTDDPTPFLTIKSVPVFCNALWPDEDAARQAATGAVELVFCRGCGLMWNAAFDPDLVAYSPRYENSLHFSPTFRDYADNLARRLVSRYDLHGKRLLEVGAGSAEFLGRLCDLGDSTATGFDPSHDPAAAGSHPRVSVLAEVFPEHGGVQGDFVTCQHVLEHVEDPAALVAAMRASLAEAGPAGVCYCEVPDGTYMLAHHAIWDVIYEHCSYFAAPTLRALFEAVGFEVADAGASFGGQYLWVEARHGDGRGTGSVTAAADEVARLSALVEDFQAAFDREVRHWTERLPAMSAEGPVAVWGAGSKGVTFLNVVETSSAVDVVVDVNPRKHGAHVPGTGHRVSAPADLLAVRPAHVLLMNVAYEAEVRAALADLGLAASLEIV